MNLTHDAGTTFKLAFDYQNEDGTPVNLTGATVKVVFGDGRTNNAGLVLTAANGVTVNGSTITVRTNKPLYNGFYGIYITFANGDVEKVLGGRLRVVGPNG